ncbi:DUF3027 domain-containing protein [Amycolatopsis coloradensis]|uniref:DUF3027 domain-containing protein n=1 Tax=Amycolatopsis coloradensis TaxID=76021 RepID=UPI003CC9175E
MSFDKHVGSSEKELSIINKRWLERRNRKTWDDSYRDEWYDEQCGGCRFWFPLAGAFGNDYGVCANANSSLDGTARSEHDGCEAFEDAGQWIIPNDM